MKGKIMRQRYAAVMAVVLFLLVFLPYLSLADKAYGAISFGGGELSYDRELVALWDRLAAQDGVDLERTDFIGHMTRTYPVPGIVIYKQQTSVSPGGKWKEYEYRNMYCISHSRELAENPNIAMETTAVWYIKKEPYTLQDLPPFIKKNTADEYCRRLNFLIMAYAADYKSYQGTVNSDPVIGTADYYLGQSFCTLSEEAKFTGDFAHDWGMYRQHATEIANRYHPSGLGSTQVYEEMTAEMEPFFRVVWSTAKLTADCVESLDSGYLFYPTVSLEEDGMYHARYPLTAETRAFLTAASIVLHGDWNYTIREGSVDFCSASGQVPEEGIAKICLDNTNGIIRKSIGNESVRELHMPVKLGGQWSLTFAQGNLIANLKEGLQIVVGSPKTESSVLRPGMGSLSVERCRHTERWQADYAVNLRKMDAETGKTLENAWFDILEAFDEGQLAGSILEDDNWDNDNGSQFLRWDGWDSPYQHNGDPDPCEKDQQVTDVDGWLTETVSLGAGELQPSNVRAHRDIKYYSYTKGYCQGHPKPDPEDEEEVEEYKRQIRICEELVREGGFYHSLYGGARELLSDRDRHYEEFVSLTYDYSARELAARNGYILHNRPDIHEPFENIFDGIHADTIPIETVKVHSSQYYDLAGTYKTEIRYEEEGMSEDSRGGDAIQTEGKEEAGYEEQEIEVEIKRKEKRRKEIAVASKSNADEAVEEEDLDDIWILDEDEEFNDWEEYEEASPSNGKELRILPGVIRIAENMSNTARFRSPHYTRGQIAFSPSTLAVLVPADPDYSGRGGSDWTFELYDYRTEGEIHINKRDLLLKKGENDAYDSYGDTQGDGTLEGAVYGLFAASDLIHPDGKTGVVFEKGDLVAITATDKNGDASFMTITEAPGTRYDYEQGDFVKTGFFGPDNEYTRMFEKTSSNQNSDHKGRWSYPISDNRSANGNCWIGRPLFLGAYYVQELARSEGYELSVYGAEAELSNRSSWLLGGKQTAAGTVQVEKMEGNVRMMEDTKREETVTEVSLLADGTDSGFDIFVKNIDPLVSPSFFLTTTGKKEVYQKWEKPEIIYEPVEAVPQTLVIIEGKGMEADIGDVLELPCGDSAVAEAVKEVAVSPEKIFHTGIKGVIPTFDRQYIPDLTGVEGRDSEQFLEECNEALMGIGMEMPEINSPYFLVKLGEDRRLWAEKLYDFLEREDCPAFNAAFLEQIFCRDGENYAVLRYSFLKEGETQDVAYSATDETFYVRYSADIPDSNVGFVYRGYPLSELSDEDYEKGDSRYYWIRVPNEKPETEEMGWYEELSELPFTSAQEFRTYWVYKEGELLRAEDGSIYQKEQIRYAKQSGYQTVETVSYEETGAVYDNQSHTWQIHISAKQIPADGRILLTVRYGNRFAGGGGSPAVTAVPSMNTDGSYIRPVTLAYPGQNSIYEDAGSRQTPVEVLERAILQKIKVQKYLDEGRMDNFRFQAYLKSNLTRLYRTEEGMIVWQDRHGQEQNAEAVLKENQKFPERVRKIYTKTLHKTTPLYADSKDAVIANEMLYGYTEGEINEEANHGYTAVLEKAERSIMENGKRSTVKEYNYQKFFDAIMVANHDKWDDAAPGYTSWRPIGNAGNRIEETLDNAKVSDLVRQFAIDWYLEDEIEKLTVRPKADFEEREAGIKEVSYPDEIYDRALCKAIRKAENYLIPFFAYDLDEIYAVGWDEEGGGSDGSQMTVSADSLEEKGEKTMYCGVSAYLPYGTYVVVEQQPQYAGEEYDRNLKDLKNKRYWTDAPKEVIVPSVYDGTEGFLTLSERLDTYYNYDAFLTQQEMERRYQIRFRPENHKIQAHNHCGDFEVYKYGMDIGLTANGVPAIVGLGDYFALTQDEYRPYKNYYNGRDDRTEGGVDYYLSEGQSGSEGIADQYRYSSVSEHGKAEDSLESGYSDSAPVMCGMQTACHGEYASMLVPWSITASEDYAVAQFNNRFFTARLRLEKLDSESHENILHDSAVFSIYAAECEDSEAGSGQVCFYEKDTTIYGTIGFLESMGAKNIRPMARKMTLLDRLLGKNQGPGNLYTGVVAAGTPICEESGKVIQKGEKDLEDPVLVSYSTVREGLMQEEIHGHTRTRQRQTVGYLETPQPLEAGAYVICEEKPPSGYVRSSPMALEIYSDKITYYKEGDRDRRVLAAVYETASGEKSKDAESMARVYVENIPIKLTVEKWKEASSKTANTTKDKTVTYKVSGRIDGKLVDIGNNPDYIYAYQNGQYLGYAWQKGTLEYLAERKGAGEQVEIAYEGSVFAGYGYVTRMLETADDENPYVAGAKMALFEAIVLTPSGDTQDYAFKDLEIIRNRTNNVTRMYLKQGEDKKERDILYYDLGNLEVTTVENIDGRDQVLGYDRNHNKVPVAQAESERANFNRTDTEHSLFAFKAAQPFLEFTGGDFTKLRYIGEDKRLAVDDGTLVYHLDRDGNRDCLIDPYTGMAYVPVPEDHEGRVMVWPVRIHKDEYGNVIARDKITTSRLATIGENEGGYEEKGFLEVINHSGREISEEEKPSYHHRESGFITGTWEADGNKESHKETTVNTNRYGQNLNGEILADDNNGSFAGRQKPVYDKYGFPVYYQKSEGSYDKGTELYDRNGDLVRYQNSDNLGNYNTNAYQIHNDESLSEEQKIIYHRRGEGYVLENIWTSSDYSPNDPFDDRRTEGQPDILKRVPAGNYIMEELESPAGYLKGMPVGVIVKETSDMQHTAMVDKTTKVEIAKIDGTKNHEFRILQRREDGSSEDKGKLTEGNSGYGYGMVSGAKLALFKAKKVYSPESAGGYYLEKTEEKPLEYEATDSREGKVQRLTAQWVTGATPIYAEGIPAGVYLLEEIEVPAGFVASEPLEVEIANTPEVQTFFMYNDHTKIEIEKFVREGEGRQLLGGAEFTLYEADENGKLTYDSGQAADTWVSSGQEEYTGFIEAFEVMYREFGTEEGTTVRWEQGESYHVAEYITARTLDASASGGEKSRHPTLAILIFEMEDGRRIRITVSGENNFEYQFNYKKLPWINEYACSYVTLDGVQRIDYLPAGKTYVLKETKPPKGYARAADQVIQVSDIRDVQRYGVENREGKLYISKQAVSCSGELVGAYLELYRAGENGEFIPDAAHLEEAWLSGSDGEYTDEDFVNGYILPDYEKGDLRPHEIRTLDDGIYWLRERKSPDFYTITEPVRIEYRQQEENQVVRIYDEPAEGRLEIIKTDMDGRPLEGTVFELRAYRKDDRRTPVLIRKISDVKGRIQVEHLPIGESMEDGRIVPYQYKLREILPPDGYAVNTRVFTWEFESGQGGNSYGPKEAASKQIVVIDEKTKVSIGKKDFDSMKEGGSGFLAGAKLALYEITGRDERDQLLYDEESLCEAWVTRGEEHIVEGLIAGRSYLLKELSVPEGYGPMEPLILTVSKDGRMLTGISNRLNTITFGRGHEKEENMPEGSSHIDDSQICSITIKGRYPVRVRYELSDVSGRILESWIGSEGEHTLKKEEGWRDGQAYTITEKTCYNDGTVLITGRKTEVLYFEEDGTCRVPGREAEKTVVEVSDGKGTELISFPVSEAIWETTIRSVSELFCQGERYLLTEYTVFSDGFRLESNRMQFVLGDQASVSGLVAADRKTKVSFSKTDITGKQELPGCHMCLKDADGREVFSWISGEEPCVLEGILIPGEVYCLEEQQPCDGFVQAESISFTMLQSGICEQIIMKDENTKIFVYKLSDDGKEEAVEGAVLQILNQDQMPTAAIASRDSFEKGKNLIFVSGREPTGILGQLRAGENYLLHEIEPAPGYAYTEDVPFCVSWDGREDHVVIKNKKTKVSILKTDDASGEPLAGALLQILDKEGRVIDQWVSGEESHEVVGKLLAGESYFLWEQKTPKGYQRTEGMSFQVPREAEILELVLKNKKEETDEKNPGNLRESKERTPTAQPEITKEPGRITAYYDSEVPTASGILANRFRGKILSLALTKDETHAWFFTFLFFLSFLGACFAFFAIQMTKQGRFAIINEIQARKKSKKEKKDEKNSNRYIGSCGCRKDHPFGANSVSDRKDS